MAIGKPPSLTRIALTRVFSSSLDFTRSFKQRFRVPSSAFDHEGDRVIRAVRRLESWAQSRGLADGSWLGYQWQKTEITTLGDCACYIAVEPNHFTPRCEIGRYRFPPPQVARIEIRGGVELELRALQRLYSSWLPRSGFVPGDAPGLEALIGRPSARGTTSLELHARVPIRRA